MLGMEPGAFCIWNKDSVTEPWPFPKLRPALFSCRAVFLFICRDFLHMGNVQNVKLHDLPSASCTVCSTTSAFCYLNISPFFSIYKQNLRWSLKRINWQSIWMLFQNMLSSVSSLFSPLCWRKCRIGLSLIMRWGGYACESIFLGCAWSLSFLFCLSPFL